MDLVVDHARQQHLSFGIQDFNVVSRIDAGINLLNPITAIQDIGVTNFTFVDKARIGD